MVRRRLIISSKELQRLIVIPSLICLIFLVLLLTLSEKSYLIEAMVSLPDAAAGWERGAFSGVPVTIRRLTKTAIRAKRYNGMKHLSIIRSRGLFEDFIVDQDLKPSLYPKRWDEVNQSWRKPLFYATFSVARDKETLEPPTWKAARKLSRRLEIQQDKNTGLFVVSLRWRDPFVGATIVNDFIAYANSYIARRAQTNYEQRLGVAETLLANVEIIVARTALFELTDVLRGRAVLVSSESEPAFIVLLPARAPEKPQLKLFRILLAIVFLLSLVFTAVQLELYKPQRYRTPAGH